MRTTDTSEYRRLQRVSVWTGSGYDTMLLGEVEDGVGHVAYNADRVIAASNGKYKAVRDAARGLLNGDYDEWELTVGLPWTDDDHELYVSEVQRTMADAHSDALKIVDFAMQDKLRYRGEIALDGTDTIEA